MRLDGFIPRIERTVIRTLREVMVDHVKLVLQHTGGNICKAYKMLGIGKATLYRFMANNGINQNDYRKGGASCSVGSGEWPSE